MKPTILLLAFAALAFPQAGSIAGVPGNPSGPRWTQSMAPRRSQSSQNNSEYRIVHTPGSGFNGPHNGPNPNQGQLNAPNSPNPFMPPHGGADAGR